MWTSPHRTWGLQAGERLFSTGRSSVYRKPGFLSTGREMRGGCLPVRMRVLAQAPQLPERRQIRQEVECSRGSTTAHLRGRRQGGAPPDSRREMASTVTPAGVALILCPSLVLSTHVPPPHVKWSRSPDLGVGGELSDPAAQPPGAGGSAGTAPARARQLCGAFSHCLPVRL